MKRFTVLAILLIFVASAALADPPKLLTTSPKFWAVGVNATQKDVSLTFDQPMRPGFWDWFGRDSLSPSSSLRTSMSSDGTGLALDVKLEPGKVYVLGLNERGRSGVGFQNEKGLSLPPIYLVFQTAGTPGANDVPPRVVRSMPANGMQSIDAARVASIAVTFDRPMNPKKHGLHLYENNQPVDISKLPFSYSADGMTFTLPYRFKPATVYKLEMNSSKDIGFARTTRVPLWPAVISFSTR
jgi:Big-like domain-containing protein